MATKIIKTWIDGAIQNVEIEDVIFPEQPLCVEERVDVLEDKHEVVFTEGNLLVGNGTVDLEEMTPEEVLEHINGASVVTMTTAEFEALEETNANTLYMMTDEEDVAILDENGKLLNSVLPEGYPYEAVETVNEPLNITWDGNTDGLVKVSDWYKISDCVLTVEQIATATVTGSDGTIITGETGQQITNEIVVVGNEMTVVFISADNATAEGLTFPEAGIYSSHFITEFGEFYISSIATTEPVEQSKKVVVPLDPKFISVGGAKFTHISEDDEGNLISSMSYAEISEALSNNSMVYCVYGKYLLHLVNGSVLSDIIPLAAMQNSFVFTAIKSETQHIVTIYEGGNVGYKSIYMATASDIPEVPVTSVNGQTGDVVIDIPEQVQADWGETDETSVSYIKNKPTEEDALALVAEMALVDPVSDETGAVYIDENNIIYTL